MNCDVGAALGKVVGDEGTEVLVRSARPHNMDTTVSFAENWSGMSTSEYGPARQVAGADNGVHADRECGHHRARIDIGVLAMAQGCLPAAGDSPCLHL